MLLPMKFAPGTEALWAPDRNRQYSDDTQAADEDVSIQDVSEIRLTQDEDEVQQIEIESWIVPELFRRHTEWIEA
ncbi:hypothetical protein BGZ81_003213, partial [Podila clonocystis]